MRYADGPSVEVEVHVEASPSTVWALVSDVAVPARFSGELQEAFWIDETHFKGRNRHPAAGEWETTCTVVANEPGVAFAWVVGEPDAPAAEWGFSIEPDGSGVVLRQRARLGPGPSGLTAAIASMPDKEERIVERRLEEHRANMQATVEGIKGLAEGL